MRQREAKNSGRKKRAWPTAVLWAAVVTGAMLALAIVVNMAVGRVIHWDIVIGLGALGFAFLSIGRRYGAL
jgi:hypothetical protein